MNKNPSTTLPTSGQNLLSGAFGQQQNQNAAAMGIFGQQLGAGSQSQVVQQHLVSSGNNSFMSGLQAITGMNSVAGN